MAAGQGFAGIAPSGPVVRAPAVRAWPAQLTATDAYLQGVLDEGGPPLDRGRVYLCGFSQGATHAYGLLAGWPARYRGAIVLSPGEGPLPPPVVCAPDGPRPLYMSYGQQEYRAFRQRARKWAAAWRRARWPCLLEPHLGGHHFPADWATRLPRILEWLREQSCMSSARVGLLGPDA
jgi:predicted esterase